MLDIAKNYTDYLTHDKIKELIRRTINHYDFVDDFMIKMIGEDDPTPPLYEDANTAEIVIGILYVFSSNYIDENSKFTKIPFK